MQPLYQYRPWRAGAAAAEGQSPAEVLSQRQRPGGGAGGGRYQLHGDERRNPWGVVGESGCGKSTTARLLMQLLTQDSGELIFDGQGVGSSRLPLKAYRRQVQMVFQDSYASLNPRLTMEESIAFGQRVHGVSAREASEYARYLLAHVGLEPARFADRYPHALSGGQRQRVNIARALAMKPRLVILDEAVSALDKSVEAQVLQLLQELKRTLELTYVFISHDLHVVRWLSDRILVMYLGEVVEIGPAEQLFTASAHPYTRALLSSMPSMDPENRTPDLAAKRRSPSPIAPPSGCRFHTRCPHAKGGLRRGETAAGGGRGRGTRAPA